MDFHKYEQKKVILVVLVGIFIMLLFLQFIIPIAISSCGGSFGLRPMSHSCIGLKISPDTAMIFPRGDIEFQFLFHFRYHVLDKSSGIFCLGQDIWFGE